MIKEEEFVGPRSPLVILSLLVCLLMSQVTVEKDIHYATISRYFFRSGRSLIKKIVECCPDLLKLILPVVRHVRVITDLREGVNRNALSLLDEKTKGKNESL